MNESLDVANAEIIEYLNITYDILKSTKSSLDINRLKTIIDILKLDEKKTYKARTKKTGFRNESIISILEKNSCGMTLSEDEKKIFDDFVKENYFFKMVQKREYSKLYELLKKEESEVTAGELSVLYFCLYGERTRQKKKADILKSIYLYIEQNVYFDNMDSKYKKDM